MTTQIKCPYCNKLFEPTDAFRHELEEKLLKETQSKHQEEIKQLKREKQELAQTKEKEIEDAKKKAAESVRKEVEEKTKEELSEKDRQNLKLKEQLEAKLKIIDEAEEEKNKLNQTHKKELEEAKKQIAEKAKLEAHENVTKELKDKEDQIAQLRKRAEEAEEEELKIRKEKRELEEAKRKFELEKQRQLDEERGKIREKALLEAQEKHELKDKEKDKMIDDLKKSLDDAQRKALQGSQQTQGEVLELELEDLFRKEFPHDKITEVKKGQRGADVIQEVIDKQGRSCGVILWESKNAKWSHDWISKLKENQRQAKAQIAVLVSAEIPPGIGTFTHQDGVWIAARKIALPLAIALRFNLIEVTSEKMINVNRSGKAAILYQYITSSDFKHRIEAIAETFVDMQKTIETEKRWFNQKWAKQEKQIRKLVDNTLGMRGDLEGLVGNALPPVDLLELPNSTEQNNDK